MKPAENVKKTCPQCGAPTKLEICPYCGAKTDLDTAHANMEYPCIECKEANIGFWTVAFPGIFAFTFSWFGICLPIFAFMDGDLNSFNEKLGVILCSILFGTVGIVAFIIMLRPIITYFRVRMHGKKVTGTVYGYLDDNVTLNGIPAQIVKILVYTKKGPRFVLYQLGRSDQPYGVGSKITMEVYNDMFLISKDLSEYNELW